MATTAALTTDHVADVLDDVRAEIAADDDALSETKTRRNLVKREASKFDGILTTFDSGSVAHGDVNDPIKDADGGAVFDRRTQPELGPDGDGVGPRELVDDVAEFIVPGIRETYTSATCEVTKRAILVEFHEPIDDEQDPSVDLIVALTRKEAPGRWIPNTETDAWDASDPERHTELLLGPNKRLRVHRARVIRLAKASIGQGATPVISSFNIEALALLYVDDPELSLAESLQALLSMGAADLADRLTPDPADVSPAIKLPEGISHETANRRLRYLGGQVQDAIDQADDRDAVVAALGEVFPAQIEAVGSGRNSLAQALTQGNGSTRVAQSLGVSAAGLKTTRAFGRRAAS